FASCNDETMLKDILSKYSRFNKMWSDAERNAGDNDIGETFIELFFFSSSPFPLCLKKKNKTTFDLSDALQFELEKEDVRLNALAFEGQSHLAAFYAFAKLKAVERTNIRWIAECINAGKKHEIESKLIHIFKRNQ
ncbi:vacuolar proton pump D subunit, partial [Reticulomyxa filosa]